MCQHTYRHHQHCGHIASLTLDACAEFVTRTHSQQKPVGHWIKTTHDLQPDSDSCCLACEVESGTRVRSPQHRGTGTSTSFSAIENPLGYISLGGVHESGPLVTADFMVTVPADADASQQEVLCYIPAGAVVQMGSGEPGKSSNSLLKALQALGLGWEDGRSVYSVPGAFWSDDFDYDMCGLGETVSRFPNPPSLSSESDSEYEDMNDSSCPPPSHQKPEPWTPGRTRLQSPAPPFHRSDMRAGDDNDSDFDELDGDNVVGPESGQDGGIFKRLRMALPSFLQDSNGDGFWELI